MSRSACRYALQASRCSPVSGASATCVQSHSPSRSLRFPQALLLFVTLRRVHDERKMRRGPAVPTRLRSHGARDLRVSFVGHLHVRRDSPPAPRTAEVRLLRRLVYTPRGSPERAPRSPRARAPPTIFPVFIRATPQQSARLRASFGSCTAVARCPGAFGLSGCNQRAPPCPFPPTSRMPACS